MSLLMLTAAIFGSYSILVLTNMDKEHSDLALSTPEDGIAEEYYYLR